MLLSAVSYTVTQVVERNTGYYGLAHTYNYYACHGRTASAQSQDALTRTKLSSVTPSCTKKHLLRYACSTEFTEIYRPMHKYEYIPLYIASWKMMTCQIIVIFTFFHLYRCSCFECHPSKFVKRVLTKTNFTQL